VWRRALEADRAAGRAPILVVNSELPILQTAIAFCYGSSELPEDQLELLLELAADVQLEALSAAVAVAAEGACCRFHSPCQLCSARVPSWLAISARHGLRDLQATCCRWLAVHAARTWLGEPFTALPLPLRERVFAVALEQLEEHAVRTLKGCAKATLADGGQLFALAKAAEAHICERWADVVKNDEFVFEMVGWAAEQVVATIAARFARALTVENAEGYRQATIRAANTSLQAGSCPACTQTLARSETLTLFDRCGHVFHAECIGASGVSGQSCFVCSQGGRADETPLQPLLLACAQFVAENPVAFAGEQEAQCWAKGVLAVQ